MSVKCIPPKTPLLYSKTEVCSDIPIFLIFAPRHGEAVQTCTHNLCFEQKIRKIYKKKSTENLVVVNFSVGP